MESHLLSQPYSRSVHGVFLLHSKFIITYSGAKAYFVEFIINGQVCCFISSWVNPWLATRCAWCSKCLGSPCGPLATMFLVCSLLRVIISNILGTTPFELRQRGMGPSLVMEEKGEVMACLSQCRRVIFHVDDDVATSRSPFASP
jgi:hypothetical protein